MAHRSKEERHRDLQDLPEKEELADLYGDRNAERIRSFIGEREDLPRTEAQVFVALTKCDRETKAEVRKAIADHNREISQEFEKFNARLIVLILAIFAAPILAPIVVRYIVSVLGG